MSDVLLLCNKTRHMGDPWLEAGYTVTTVDMQPADVEQLGRTHIIADVRTWSPHWSFRPHFIAAFPPCTHVAVCGAKHFKVKGLGALIDALEVLNSCRRICEGWGGIWMLENPVSVFASYWRKPDYYFHPWQFTGFELGDHYTKKTCLWTSKDFIMPEPNPHPSLADIEPDDRIHKETPSEERRDIRSVMPRGFARAVFEANHIRKAQAA